MIEETEALVISTSEIFETIKASEPFESIINKLKINKSLKSIKLISKVIKTLFENIESSNKKDFLHLQIDNNVKSILKKKAIKFNKDSNVFIIIIEKDKLNSIAFQKRIETNTWMCSYAKEIEEDLNKYINITV